MTYRDWIDSLKWDDNPIQKICDVVIAEFDAPISFNDITMSMESWDVKFPIINMSFVGNLSTQDQCWEYYVIISNIMKKIKIKALFPDILD